jgi:DNA gyrase/topoisomerase IV subunit B
VVEGDSAAKSVFAVCSKTQQQVLGMQGKPLNAWKASLAGIAKYAWYARLLETLGYAVNTDGKSIVCTSASTCRIQRVVLLFDPDADGIHCEALLLMFFYRILRPLVEDGRLFAVRAPSHRFVLQSKSSKDFQESSTTLASAASEPSQRVVHAYSGQQARGIIMELKAEDYEYVQQRYRGLASLDSETLLKTCVDPLTRQARQLTCEDAEAAVAVFGGALATPS